MIVLLMLVSLLPWGAYAAAHVAHAAGLVTRHAVILVSTEMSPATDSRATHPAPGPTLALAPKKCRTASLPGFSCSPDPAIGPVLSAEPTANSGDVVRYPGDWTGSGAAEEPPTGPPRSI